MKNIILSLFLVLLIVACNHKVQNNQTSSPTGFSEDEIDENQTFNEQIADQPDFSWCSTIEESEMELTEEGEISVNFWGFWKGVLELDDQQPSTENYHFLIDNNIQIVAGNSDLNSNLIPIDSENNVSKFYPNFGD